jgi:uncharacterized protein involved in response to NO
LTADRVTQWVYILVNLAALSRVAAAFIPSFTTCGWRLSAILWIAAFTLFTVKYGPFLWSQRPASIKE